MMSPNVIKIAKAFGKLVVGIGLPLATNYFEKKALRAEITKIATEVVAKATKQN